MAKRSNFQRRAADKYMTPFEATLPLVPFLLPDSRFIEPCAGDGRLVRHLERHGMRCVQSFDILPDCLSVAHGDALTSPLAECDMVISNFPWTRQLLHPIIERMMNHAPTWSLHDANWMFTSQRGEVSRLMNHCSHIVTVGRVRWIEGSGMSGKDDSCWYRFDASHTGGAKFYPR